MRNGFSAVFARSKKFRGKTVQQLKTWKYGREIAGRHSRRRLSVDLAARATSQRNLTTALETRQLALWAEETRTIASRRGASSNTVTEHLSSENQRGNRQDFGAHAADAVYAAGERWSCWSSSLREASGTVRM